MRAPFPGKIAALVAIAAAATVVPIGLAMRAEQRALASDRARPPDLHGAAHAGSAACRACHPDHTASWQRTFHRTMTQDVGPARAAAVAGDFSGVTYRYGGVTARMHRDGRGRFLMTFAGTSTSTSTSTVASVGGNRPVEVEVVRAVGSRRYQQYLAEVDGALWRLPMAFHIAEKRWFHMNGAFLTPDPDAGPGDASDDDAAADAATAGRPRFGGGAFDRHVTRWNDNCVFCHNVAANPGRDPDTGAFCTTVAELGIACEACHGPGDEHGRRNADPLRRYALHLSGAADPTVVNPSRLSSSAANDLCGRCHGQRITDDVGPFLQRGDPFVPGDSLALYSAPLWRDTALAGDRAAFAPRFWGDGTPRLTAYEYQGLLQSRCAQQGGLTCTTCHGMHEGDPAGQIRPAAAGDRACTGCHRALAAPPAAAAHARHDPARAGARCVSCHMPRIVYGVLDAHVSHRIEIPEPAGAIAAGRPDACTLCHVDRDRAWAARERARLWPPPPAQPNVPGSGVHDDGMAPAAALFAGDPVSRALAADALGRAPPLAATTPTPATAAATRAAMLLEAMAGDRYPAVRHLAARALGRISDRAGPPAAAAAARAFDATAPTPARARALADLRALLPAAAAAAPDPASVASLRARARAADIDIGE